MMRRYIQRDSYLQKLIVRKDNGEVKVITGPRRSGKSFLLDPIYKDYLIGIMKRTNYRQIRFAQKEVKSHGNVQNVDINGKQL